MPYVQFYRPYGPVAHPTISEENFSLSDDEHGPLHIGCTDRDDYKKDRPFPANVFRDRDENDERGDDADDEAETSETDSSLT